MENLVYSAYAFILLRHFIFLILLKLKMGNYYGVAPWISSTTTGLFFPISGQISMSNVVLTQLE